MVNKIFDRLRLGYPGSAVLVFLVVVSASLSWPATAKSAQLKIHYSILQRALARDMFGENERHYLFGGDGTPCLSAFLRNPEIASSGDSLKLRMYFTGFLGQQVGGTCVGLSDSFYFNVLGVPSYQNGFLTLRNIRIEGGSEIPELDNRLREYINKYLQQYLRYDLEEGIYEMIAENSHGVIAAILFESLNVSQIKVEENRVSLEVDLSLVLQ